MKIAVLDLGSNSFHLLVARVEPGLGLVKIDGTKEMVRLGAGTLQTGVIDEPSWRRAFDALGRLVGRARMHGPKVLVAVATSAIREAKNGREFAEAARLAYGIDVDILAGPEEARLVYLGARAGLPHLPERMVVVDVGGGSVELAAGTADRCQHVESLPLGVLRLREAYVPADGHVSERTANVIAAAVRSAADDAVNAVLQLKPRHVVFTSGTARAVARLAHDLGTGRGESGNLSRDAVQRLVGILAKFKPAALPVLGVEEGRVDTIATGAVVLGALMALLRAESAVVSDHALREGVAARELGRLGLSLAPSRSRPLLVRVQQR